MKLSHVINAIEAFAPRWLQESWDNSGLQIGLPDGNGECTGVLLCVDVDTAVIEEAVSRGCNLVISHHPLIFKGFKNLTGSNEAQRAALAAVRAGVAVYSAHTSLDSTYGGISYAMASMLGATVDAVLAPAPPSTSTVTVFCPRAMADDVRMVMLDNGTGIAPCSENGSEGGFAAPVDNTPWCISADADKESLGIDSMEPVPTFSLNHTPLCRVEASVPTSQVGKIKAALRSIPDGSAIRIVTQPDSDIDPHLGLGVIARFPDKGISGTELLEKLKEVFGIPAIRASLGYKPDMTIRRIGLCGGAGGEFIGKAINAGADAYVCADIRYHDFVDNRHSACAIFDIGHFESEKCAKRIFYHVITNKFPNFAVYYSEKEQNPVQYL